ncbi:MAG: hypothetical protein M3416_05880 [Acidobacteriota bacterium]|nr:hypothetical protein [Acidobacteriota bacterium]
MTRPFTVLWIFMGFLCLTGCTRPETIVHSIEPGVAKVRGKEAVEYAVYAALIKEMYVEDKIKMIAIREHTALHPMVGDGLLKELERVRQKMPAVSQEMVDNFIEENKHSRPLENAFNLSVPSVLIGEKEYEEIFQDADGWQTFYRKYPASQGLMTLSKVGFNSVMNQALVYVGNQHAGLGGAGYYVLLSMENGAWIIQDKSGAWIS